NTTSVNGNLWHLDSHLLGVSLRTLFDYKSGHFNHKRHSAINRYFQGGKGADGTAGRRAEPAAPPWVGVLVGWSHDRLDQPRPRFRDGRREVSGELLSGTRPHCGHPHAPRQRDEVERGSTEVEQTLRRRTGG